ncbi:SUKH-3 domain-containing protein [Streptomyces griseosporeus]|uniref:SUKH-3 domain-containing protein n=1 Tax=Streptomyces griseosporeus TaxID=1910 RepID=UPI0036CAC829
MLKALDTAGWAAGRKIAITEWTRKLTDAGFELNDAALAVWTQFGGLTIRSSSSRVPASCLHLDPVDACIDAAEEAATLERRYGENYSPLGMWSNQFLAYISASGRVIAVGPHWVWPLGATFMQALAYVVDGDGGVNREERADWLDNCRYGK